LPGDLSDHSQCEKVAVGRFSSGRSSRYTRSVLLCVGVFALAPALYVCLESNWLRTSSDQCKRSDCSFLCGEWRYEGAGHPQSIVIYYIFHEDGTGMLGNYSHEDGTSTSCATSWQCIGDKILLTTSQQFRRRRKPFSLSNPPDAQMSYTITSKTELTVSVVTTDSYGATISGTLIRR
jgi:hypothetical protein